MHYCCASLFLEWGLEGQGYNNSLPLASVMLVSSPPTATTFFSSRVRNVCYFVTPEGVHLFHTSILTRLSLSCSPHVSHREAWVCKKAKNPWMIAIYMLHSSVQRLEAVLNSPHGCAVLTPGQLQPPDSKERERCPPLCVTYSQLCPLHSSCRQGFHFQGLKAGTAWLVATHFGETFILNQISNAKGDWRGRRCKQIKSAISLSCCFYVWDIQRSHWTGGHYFHR